jgi:hypothetical protein
LRREAIAPDSGLPSDRHPDRIERAIVLGPIKDKPPAALKKRRPCQPLRATAAGMSGSGRGNGLSSRTKKLDKGKKNDMNLPLDFHSPIQGFRMPAHGDG